MRVRKRPIEVEAWRWVGSFNGAPAWVRDAGAQGVLTLRQSDRGLTVTTLEGLMVAQPGDWIIRGVAGELYPCKPGVFDATYEVLES
jgi:hypothetical protein